jgi:dipeptidyl aminopeptidase/acylaminoacyl peptidase
VTWTRTRRIILTGLAIAGAFLGAMAQEVGNVDFDPTPARIPLVQKHQLRPITSMDLLTIRDIKGLSISPNGQYVAFVVGQAVYETNSYRSGMYVVSTALGSTPICLGSAGVPHWDLINQWVPDPPQWSPDSKYITYRAKIDNAAHWQVWRWTLDGKPPSQLSSVPGDVQSFHWDADGSKLVIGIEKDYSPAEVERLADDGIVYDGTLNATHSRPVVTEALTAKAREKETWIHFLATGEERIQTPAEAEPSSSWINDIGEDYFNGATFVGHHILDAKLSPDGQRVAYRYIDDSPGAKVLYRLFSKSVSGGSPVDIAPGSYFVSGYWWSNDSTRIYYSQNAGDGGPDQLMVVPAEGGTAKQVFTSVEFLSWFSPDKNFRYMACTSESRTAPGSVALVDLQSGFVRTLVDLNPEFTSLTLSPARRLEGINRFGDRWRADLVKPLNFEPGQSYPLIVTTYRTREFPRGASGDENPIYVFAANGFFVLSFDYGRREFDNDPGDFRRHLSWYESVQASIEMAIKQAAETGSIDIARTGLTGYSRGEEIVAYAITHSKLFHAVSGAAGDNGPYFYYMAPKAVQEYFVNSGLGWPQGQSKGNWKQIALELNAERIETPILNNDPDSEFLWDLALYTSLKALRKPMELIIYPNELHVVNQPKHRYQMYERNLDWFRFWLKEEEDPDPAKAEQYKRWRELRKLQEQSSTRPETIRPND